MGVILLTVVTSCMVPLGIAFWLSLVGRTNMRWLFLLLALLSVLFPVVALGEMAWMSYQLKYERYSSPSYFWHCACLFGFVSVASVWLLLRGSMRREGKLRAGGWPWLRILVAWLLAAAIQLLIVYLLNRQAQVFAEQASAKAAGELAALAGPPPADSDNAWPIYERAFADMASVFAEVDRELRDKAIAELGKRTVDEESKREPSSAGELLDKEYAGRPDVQDLLRRSEPVIELLRQAAQRPANRATTSVGLPDIMAPGSHGEYKNLRTATLLLQAHAIEMARQGRMDTAVADLATMHRLADHVDQSFPCLVGGLVRIGAHACAYETVTEVLPHVTKSVDAMTPANASGEALRQALDRDFRGEELLTMGTALGFSEGSLTYGGIPAKVGLLYRILWLEGDIPMIHALMESQRGSIRGKQPDMSLYGKGGIPKAGPLVQILVTSMQRAIGVNTELEARAAIANLAVALTHYRLDHHEYPAEISLLAPQYLPAIPPDPFDQKPMRYRLAGKDAIIYSMGANRVDDGGAIGPDARREHSDVGIRLRFPEQAVAR